MFFYLLACLYHILSRIKLNFNYFIHHEVIKQYYFQEVYLNISFKITLFIDKVDIDNSKIFDVEFLMFQAI